VAVSVSYGSRVSGAVTFSVRDYGPSISAQMQESQFSFKPPSGMRDEQGGHSSGLSYCAKVVDLHGGDIGCESPGKGGGGSEFYFCIIFEPCEEEDD
jgi:signal transduction histidine kinase